MDAYLLDQPVATGNNAQPPKKSAGAPNACRAGFIVSIIVAVISIVINLGLILVAAVYFSITAGSSHSPKASNDIPGDQNVTCHIGHVSAGLQEPGPRMIAVPANNTAAAAVCWDSASDIDPRVVSPYELQVDDWWTKTGFYTVYSGNKRSFTQTDLVPGITYRYRLLVRHSIGQDPLAIYTNITLPGRGGCGNIKDMTLMRDKRGSIKKEIQLCLIESLRNDNKAKHCMMGLGMSSGCSSCWVKEGDCTLSECLAPCLAPASAKCAQCSKRNCFPGCVECGGAPMWTFPP